MIKETVNPFADQERKIAITINSFIILSYIDTE